ncbi:MAG TPA: hypothetical protein VIP11_00320, partial [Gemmatimonadaceae bacterium]
EGESLQSVFYKIVSESPPELGSVVPNLPPTLNEIAMRALAKDPAVRYATASDMANDLTEARAYLDRVSSKPKALSLQSSISNGLSTRRARPASAPASRSHLIIAGAAGVVILLAGIGIAVKLASRGDGPATQTAAAPTTFTTTPPTAVVSAASPVAPAPQQSVPVQPAGTAKTAEKTPTRPVPKTEPVGATAQELALIRSLQSAALESRRRATEAGASAEQLRTGDDHSLAANTAALQGKVSDAASHLNLANTAWTAAERDARAAAAAAAATKVRVAEPPKQESIPVPPPSVTSAPAPAPQPTSQPVAAKTPAASPSVEIGAVVAAYERAIGTRDVAEVRRAYPGMTAAQGKGWEDFFKSLRSISATLSMDGLDVRGDAAEARVTGAYDYVNTAGKNSRQSVSFRAAFRKEGGAWRLVNVR